MEAVEGAVEQLARRARSESEGASAAGAGAGARSLASWSAPLRAEPLLPLVVAGVTAAARLETLRARSASAGSPEHRPRSRGAAEGGDGGDDGGAAPPLSSMSSSSSTRAAAAADLAADLADFAPSPRPKRPFLHRGEGRLSSPSSAIAPASAEAPRSSSRGR
jgi:hypothetical protein